MNDKYPQLIQDKLAECGLNHAEKLDTLARNLWILSAVDSEGNPIPTGLPFVYEIKDNKLTVLSVEESFKLIERYG